MTDRLTGQVSLAIIAALLLALGGLSAYVWGIPLIGGGLLDKLDRRTEQRDRAIEVLQRFVAESDRRKEAGKRAIEADKPKAEARAKARTIIQYRESECETPPDIIEALDQGWVR